MQCGGSNGESVICIHIHIWLAEQARELKSVQLDVPAGAVRLVLHAPHANRFNTYQQV